MNLKNTENLWVLGLFLGITGLISAVLLAVFSHVAAGPIAAAELRDVNIALGQILPKFDNQPSANVCEMKSPDGMDVKFMGALENGKLVAVAAQATDPKGYGGPVTGLVGLDPDGKIRAVLITSQHETPGLGENVCARKRKRTIFNLLEAAPKGLAPNPILDQFDGKIADPKKNWEVKKDGGTMEYVTGATVTSRAVTRLVSEIDRTYLANQAGIAAKLGGKK